MSIINEQMMEDPEADGFVESLIERGFLDGAALGVAKKWLGEGLASLSDKQRYVLKTHVFEPYVTETCVWCHQTPPWSEMLDTYDNGGYCSYCVQHKVDF